MQDDEGSPSWWELDKLHGGVRSLGDQLVHRGARHHLASDGRWLQPEPLLYLGLTNGDLAEPLGYGPVYARGNSNEWADLQGDFAETPFDVLSVGVGLGSALYNYTTGNTSEARLDMAGVGIDVGAVAMPGVPAVGATLNAGRRLGKALKAVDKTADTVRTTAKATGGAQVQANRVAGQLGERFLADTYGGAQQVYRRTTLGGRYIDNLVDGVAQESKVGRTSLSRRVRKQIAKDVEMMNTPGSGVDSVEWHFFPSDTTGVGPTGLLRKALEEAGITIVEH